MGVGRLQPSLRQENVGEENRERKRSILFSSLTSSCLVEAPGISFTFLSDLGDRVHYALRSLLIIYAFLCRSEGRIDPKEEASETCGAIFGRSRRRENGCW